MRILLFWKVYLYLSVVSNKRFKCCFFHCFKCLHEPETSHLIFESLQFHHKASIQLLIPQYFVQMNVIACKLKIWNLHRHKWKIKWKKRENTKCLAVAFNKCVTFYIQPGFVVFLLVSFCTIKIVYFLMKWTNNKSGPIK